MKKLILITIVCLGFTKANAQADFKKLYGLPNIPSLHVGDQVPDFTIPKLMNSAKESVKISDFKDQLLIIDFWHTGCSSCIQGLPHMEALQKQFGNKIKILPSTFITNKDGVLKNWWENNKYTKNLTITSVIEDKLLLSYFPHRYTPHEVWIYKGKVIAFTDADYVTADNIEKVLSGAQITWPVKDDFYVFDGSKQFLFPLDSNQVNVKSTFIKYAAIDGFRESIGTRFAGDGKVMDGIVRDPVKKTVRYFNANFPAIYNLYRINFSYSGKENGLERPYDGKNQIVWEVTDPYQYTWNEKLSSADRFRKNGVCFESLNTDTGQTDKQVYESVITDLNRLLGLNVRWEKRKERVLILIRTSKTDQQFKSKRKIPRDPFGNPLEESYVQKRDLHQFRDDYLGSFVGRLNNINTNPYVYDSTGYDGPVDMDLKFSSWTDIAGIRKALAPYGLDLKEEERLVDKLIFTEVNGGLLVK